MLLFKTDKINNFNQYENCLLSLFIFFHVKNPEGNNYPSGFNLLIKKYTIS